MNKETLEEAAKDTTNKYINEREKQTAYLEFIEGAKWQQEQAEEIEKEKQSKLWTNEEVFDMLYKTDKFLMIELREYWKTIKK
jgi:hypothetical protein